MLIKIFNAVLLTMMILNSDCTLASTKPKTSDNIQASTSVAPLGRLIAPTGRANWQIHYLPNDWVKSYLAGTNIDRAYIMLAPPHSSDLDEAYAPCAPPSRIVLGVVEKKTLKRREYKARCLFICKLNGRSAQLYRNLWAAYTHLDGVSVQILDQGRIDVVQYYRERVFTPPTDDVGPLKLKPLSLGKDVRIRHDFIKPSEFRFASHSAGACGSSYNDENQ